MRRPRAGTPPALAYLASCLFRLMIHAPSKLKKMNLSMTNPAAESLIADSIITVRRSVPEDSDFLFNLYCAARAPEFALLALPEEQKQQLILMQFAAQQNAYHAQYPGSDYVIVLRNGRPSAASG
jgi:hypothetical protein